MRQSQADFKVAGLGIFGRAAVVLALGMAVPAAQMMAQDQTAPTAPAASAPAAASSPDSQTDANVLTALGTSKDLANVAITTNTVNGVVTLTGVVRDDNQKQLAESLTAHAAGVSSVVNKLTISAAPVQDTTQLAAQTQAELPQTAVLQSDTDAAAPAMDASAPGPAAQADENAPQQAMADNGQSPTQPQGQSSVAVAPPPVEQGGPAEQGPPAEQANQNGPPSGPPAEQGPPADQADQNGPPSGPQTEQGPPADQADQNGPPSGPQTEQGPPADQADQNGPPNGPPMNGPQYQQYPQYQRGYGRQQYQQQQEALPPQIADKQVDVPAGSLLRIRTLEPIDARNDRAGASFNAVVLNNVIADGTVAIPRGAVLQGTVIEAKKAGAFGGAGKLEITLNTISLGRQGYTLTTDAWSNTGPNKTGNTVGSAIGYGVMGALIGAAVGGGPGAAIGGAAGGATGIAASGASPTRQAYIPAEAVLIFHLLKPLDVTTISQEEMNRLAQNVPPLQGQQPRMMRRGYGYYGYPGGYPPPPPPGYYGYGYRY